MKSIFSNQMVPIFVAWLAAVSALFLPVETATFKGASGLLWVLWFLPAQATDLMSDVFTLRIDNFLLGLWFGTIELFCVIALLYPLIFWLVAKRGKRRVTMTLFYFTSTGALLTFMIQLVTGPLFSIGFVAYMFSLVANAAICLVFAARQATTTQRDPMAGLAKEKMTRE
jgi:peptidoglycan/LPS O-acetylase OafA/YrhL